MFDRDKLIGLFETRRSRRHPWVAAKVEIRDDRLVVTLDGTELPQTWPILSMEEQFAGCLLDERDAFREPLVAIWLFGRKVDETTYRHRLRIAEWARAHNPSHPAANPDQPINFALLPMDAIIP